MFHFPFNSSYIFLDFIIEQGSAAQCTEEPKLWQQPLEKKELIYLMLVDLQGTGGTAQICLPDLASGQVLRVRENRVAWGNVGGASFDWRVLELGKRKDEGIPICQGLIGHFYIHPYLVWALHLSHWRTSCFVKGSSSHISITRIR